MTPPHCKLVGGQAWAGLKLSKYSNAAIGSAVSLLGKTLGTTGTAMHLLQGIVDV